MPNERLLKIYLNDHLAGSTGGLELARRCQSNNKGTELGDLLAGIITEIEDDRKTLEAIMDHLKVPKDPAKQAIVWAAEKVGRLKLNGQITGYSDLSRVLELEALSLGIAGKASLWRALRSLPPAGLPDGVDLQALESRADAQREAVEAERRAAAAKIFS